MSYVENHHINPICAHGRLSSEDCDDCASDARMAADAAARRIMSAMIRAGLQPIDLPAPVVFECHECLSPIDGDPVIDDGYRFCSKDCAGALEEREERFRDSQRQAFDDGSRE